MQKLDQTISEMKSLGEQLVEFTHPKADTSIEDDITVLRGRDVMVDGYHLTLFYSKADYGDYNLETFQVLGKWTPFVPFTVVCKLAKKFLGDKELCLVEIFLDQRKTYVWTLTTGPDSKPRHPVQAIVSEIEFEGLTYCYMDPSDVNFF
jgi:hypothetical protein